MSLRRGRRARASSPSEQAARAGEYWSRRAWKQREVLSWWQEPIVVAHVNERICGEPVSGVSGGDVELLRRRLAGRAVDRGVSVGCGNAIKEIALLEAGLVEHFDLYEVAEERIAFATALAEQRSLTERITWHEELIDFSAPHRSVDLVYWNSALHHMLDVAAAVGWSRRVLGDGGIFFINDFVGPTRMQWPDEMLEQANSVRKRLPRRMFKREGRRNWPRKLRREPVRKLIAKDPTECADSDSILPQLNHHFPDADVTLTGGVVYHLALHGLYGNFRPGDSDLLRELLQLDDELADGGMTHFAVAVAEV